MASESRSPWRRVGPLLLVVVLPSAVLIALGVQLARQEKALADQQALAERELVATRAREALLGTLERIRREALAGLGVDAPDLQPRADLEPPVVLAARVDQGVLRLPWLPDQAAEIARESLRSEPALLKDNNLRYLYIAIYVNGRVDDAVTIGHVARGA